MSSSFSTRKRYEKQNPGENNNTWGGFLNTNALDLIDETFGITSVAFGTTVGDKTLSTANGASDQGRRSILVLQGVPASNVSLFVPAQQSFYIVRSKHTGTHKINIKANGGTVGVDFASTENGLITCNGSQVREIYRTPSAGTFSGVPSGAIFAFSGSVGALPTGYVVCDGTNSTPNLSERFILGTVSDGGSGRTGTGLNLAIVSANVSLNQTTGSTVLTSANIPAHAHYMFNDSATNQRFDTGALTNVNAKVGWSNTVGNDNSYSMAGQVTTADPLYGQTSWSYASVASGHTHTIAFEAGHKHTLTITEGRPPFYSLLYMMKS